MYYFSMFLAVIASIFYHLSQKSINESINPVVSMTVTYAVALILSLIAVFFFSDKATITVESFKQLNWASYTLGFAVFVLEIGFLLAYRNGWNINIAGLFCNVLTAIVLIFIGIYIFKEQLSLVNTLGIALSIIGLVLMQK